MRSQPPVSGGWFSFGCLWRPEWESRKALPEMRKRDRYANPLGLPPRSVEARVGVSGVRERLMHRGSEQTSRPHLAAIEAIKDLRDSLDAYVAIEAMLFATIPTALPPKPGQLGALMLALNTKFTADLARAEAALGAG